jgi:prophage tail gpP-like protein
MNQPIDPVVQHVTVTANAARSDDVTILIDGRSYGGWQDVRITRGIERLPSDFELRLTDLYAADADALQIKPGDPCTVRIGGQAVITGYVDIVTPSISKDEHAIAVYGRSKCADLVDCSAEWPNGQIVGSSVLEVARKLAEPYGITVEAVDDAGAPIPKFNLMRGESAYEIIERLCRFRALLAYDDEDGNLLLARASTTQRAASGFRQGINVESASATLSMHERFSEYRCYMQPVAKFLDVGNGGDLIASRPDQTVKRHRLKILIAESSGGGIGGQEVAAARAGWESSRRFGRSFAVRLTTDSWRDKAGSLYQANTLVALDLPTLKVSGRVWTISEVTYRKGADGTHCDLVIMPPQAFDVAPAVFDSALAAEVAGLPDNLGVR